MKSNLILVALIAIAIGIAAGASFASQKPVDDSRIYDAITSIPLTEMSSYTLLHKMAANDTDFVVVDTRNIESYELGHIKGAISFTFADLGNPALVEALPRDKELILYCWSHECMLAPTIMSILAEKGFTNIKELRIGWCEWSERGYPIEGTRYIVADECMVPQRSINNETVTVIPHTPGSVNGTCSDGANC